MLGAAERDERHRQMGHRTVRNIDARRLMFVDKSGANIRLTRRYGWAPKGKRSGSSIPRNYGKNLTLFASLSLRGMSSAMVLEGAADSNSFWLGRRAASPEDLAIEERQSDAPRPGAPARITAEQGCQVAALACTAPERSGRPITHWTGREIDDEIRARGVVDRISPCHAARLLKTGT